MKTVEVPMLLVSVVAFCLLPSFDIPPVYADFQFGPPVNTTTDYTTSGGYATPCISTDGLELYYAAHEGMSDSYDGDIWLATRQSIEDDWGEPVLLGWPITTSYNDTIPRLSFDGLTLYFVSDRPGGHGNLDIWMTTRPDKNAPWESPINLGSPVNTEADESHPSITADGLELYFYDYKKYRDGGHGRQDIWVSTRPTTNDPWGAPMNLGPPVNTPNHEGTPHIMPDGLTLLIASVGRSGEYGPRDLWMARRSTRGDDWGTPVNLGPHINSSTIEDMPYITPDGSRIIFQRLGTGTCEAPILPVVDFDGDGQVDGKEVLTLTDHWGLDDPLCDIGPTPLGDGIVDIQDVVVLSDYLGKEVKDTTLVAHWALDETEGYVASDSARENDAFLSGDAIWHPDGGEVGGAIELDGVDDCLMTQSFMDPAEQPFSVLAWVKGGAAGQTIISQSGATDWLYIDPVGGTLMSKLSHNSWNAAPLASGVVITDGQWHRVGFVWDGITRALYVDEQEVIRDGQPQLASSDRGLVIGGGAMSMAGTYFGGMIDDVRIYNRVVRP